MSLTGSRTYVGFGFGAIQAGLFLYEAFRSGGFRRLVVAEVVPAIVAEVRRAAGFFSLNIAHLDCVEAACVGPVEMYDPAVPADRQRLVEAIAQAEELATAIPNVDLYTTAGPGSLHRILADGLARKVTRLIGPKVARTPRPPRPGNGPSAPASLGPREPRAVVYTAENHNRAAEILRDAVFGEVPEGLRDALRARVRFLNTVIGKMSGVVGGPDAQGLVPVTPSGARAFLVEEFNRILISRIDPMTTSRQSLFEPPFERGLAVFEEKEDLLPFEEAKLYGHNATHALAAYLGRLLGVARMADLRDVPGLLPFLRDAFLLESGEALIRRHGGQASPARRHRVDPLFSRPGYAAYADDLLRRMTNPFLMDTVERVARDPGRKLGWEDRLVGTIRLALRQGIEAWRYGVGAAAALAALDGTFLEGGAPVSRWTRPIWEGAPSSEQERVNALVEAGRRRLRAWRDAGIAKRNPECSNRYPRFWIPNPGF